MTAVARSKRTSALRAFRYANDRAGLALVVALACYALIPLCVALVPGAAQPMIARFHLRSESFVLWWAAQPSPWMYNFENRFLVSEKPLSDAELDRPPSGLRWQAANHHVARTFTFADGRARYLREPGERYFYLESRYRRDRLRTAYCARVPDEASDARAVIHIARMEALR